jgi:signal transduction histidine kinase
MSRLKLLSVGFLVVLAFRLNAQNESLIREIKDKISKTNDDKALFGLLNDLGWEYRFAYPDSTIFYCEQAYELGKKLVLKKDLSRPLNYLGVAYDKKGEPINAYEKYQAAYNLAEQQLDSNQIAYSNNNIGRLLSDQGIHARALEYFFKAQKIFEAVKDTSGLAYVHQSIGRIHNSQRDYKSAEDNFYKAYILRLAIGNTRDIMAALVLLGTLHQDANQIDKSLVYLEKADSAGQVINDRINLAEIKILQARNYLSKGMLDRAQALSSEGLTVISGQNAMRTLPDALLIRGQVLEAQSKLKDARTLYARALELSNQIKELDVILRAHYLLWKLSEKLGNRNESILHYNQYLVIQDSLKDLEVTRNLERFQFEIEIQKRELENQLSKARAEAIIETARLQNIILSLVSVFTLTVIVIMWINNKKKQVANKKLLEQNSKLEELNHEKDTLMNIVAHDLKSPLHRISGLTHLLEKDNPSESSRQYIEIIKKTTKSGLTLIADLLDLNAVTESKLKPVFHEVNLQTIIDGQIENYKETAAAKNISIKKLFNEETVVATDAEFITRIIDNLLSNSIKFSHPNSMVSINCGIKGSEFFISVKDTGPGFSEKDKGQMFQKFKRLSAQPTARESSNGLGLALIKNLVEKLSGKIQLVSEPRQGSEFMIILPLHPVHEMQPAS